MQGTKFVDSGGGFLIEESIGPTTENDKNAAISKNASLASEKETLEMPIKYKDCIECNEKFALSYLYDNFNYSVCDTCRFVNT